MSKITTVIKMMETMKQEENKTMHVTGELTSSDDLILTVDREVERGHGRSRAFGGPEGRGHKAMEGKGDRSKSRRPFGKGHGEQEGKAHDFLNKFKEMGFSDEELETLKASKEVLMHSRPKPKDRALMGLKMLDRLEEGAEGDVKTLTLKFTNDDIPPHMVEMRKAVNDHTGFADKLKKVAEEKGHKGMTKLAEHMEEMTSLPPHMSQVQEALEAKGIDFNEVALVEGKVTARVSKDNKLTKVIWVAELKDGQGQPLFFKGEGVPA